MYQLSGLGTVFSTYFIISEHVVETNILDTSLVKVLQQELQDAGEKAGTEPKPMSRRN